MAAAFRAGAARMAISGENPSLLAEPGSGEGRARQPRAIAVPTAGARADHELRHQLDHRRRRDARLGRGRLPGPAGGAGDGTAMGRDLRRLARRRRGPDRRLGRRITRRCMRARRCSRSGTSHALHFRGPGTDLSVGLADGHQWLGGSKPAKNGIVCNPNIPTEEVFTTPHKDRVDGTVRSTKPLSYQGTLIEGIAVRFEARPHRRCARDARRGGAEARARHRRRRAPPRRGRAGAELLADLAERASVLQHAVRRERREPHRARPGLQHVRSPAATASTKPRWPRAAPTAA